MAPPVVTKAEYLPLGELSWSDVERLFLRLAERDGRTEYAGLYGTAGQGQEGIDLVVRLAREPDAPKDSPRRYMTLQSKHVKTLTPARITAAVDKFLDGSWAGRSESFIYATTHDLRPTELAEEVSRQADRLEDLGIRLVPWGREAISEQLRQLPETVDDFFGRPWAKAFCGPEAAQALAGRLPGQDVARLRAGLRGLYRTAFALQDTGAVLLSPAAPTQPPAPLAFVTLDVTDGSSDVLSDHRAGTGSRRERTHGGPAPGLDGADENTAPTTDRGEGQPSWHELDDVPPVDRTLQLNRVQDDLGGSDVARTACDEWLADGNLSVVAGGPGAGKSSLLRFVVADLLDEEPSSSALAAQFGAHLPVWMPFSFLCEHLKENTERSIESAARAWLTRYSAQHLHQLVTQALADDRLLLVVDGLDEWTDEDSAQPALTLLENFVRSRKVAAIVSSRPYALRRLVPVAGWRVGHLAPLSADQQQHMIRAAFAARARAVQAPGQDETHLAGETAARFRQELDAVADLRALATVPLFLLMLTGMWSSGPLPTRRIEAYRRLVDVLLEQHPAIRRRDIRLPHRELDAREIRQVLAAAAYELRQADAGPVASTRQWRETLIRALQDDTLFSYDEQTARRLASQIMETAEGELGVLIPQGAATLGFAHRAVAEQLAAEHLVAQPLAEQKDIVRTRADSRAWRDVLLALLAGQGRPNEVTDLLEAAINTDPDASVSQMGGYELAADVLAAGIRMPPRDVARFAQLLCDRIEDHPWLPHRGRLLASLTGALAETTARRILLPWFTRKATQVTDAPDAYWSLRRTDIAAPAAETILLRALRNPSDQVRHAAAQALAQRFGGTDQLAHTLGRLAREGSDARIQAAALEALVTGWSQHPATADLISWGRRQGATGIRAMALYAYRVMQRETASTTTEPALDDSDRQWLLSLLEHDSWQDSWDRKTAELVSEAAQDDTTVRDLCLAVLSGAPGRPGAPGSRSLAWWVLLTAFPQDPHVIQWAADTIGSDEYLPYSLQLAPDTWAREPAIRNAVQTRLVRETDTTYMTGELSHLVRLAPTSQVRDLLITGLDASFGTAAAAHALIDHYSTDPTARDALLRKINAPADEAVTFADLVADLLGPADGMERLIQLIGQRPRRHLPHAIFALARLWINCKDATRGKPSPVQPDQAADVLKCHTAHSLARLCLDAVPAEDFGTARGWIIGAWPEVPEVLAYARQCLTGPAPEVGAVLIGYGPLSGPDAAQIVTEATALLSPLDPALRVLIAQQLTRRGIDAAVVTDLLQNWRRDTSGSVRRAAATALARTHATTPAPVPDAETAQPSHAIPTHLTRWHQALQRLQAECRQELVSYDLDTGDDRRRTAWVIALLLGDLTSLADAVERDGSPAAAEIDDPLTDHDPQLADLIASHWAPLQDHCDGKLPERLTGRVSGRKRKFAEVWSRLAPVASRHPHLHRALSEAVDNEPELLREPRIFTWYADSNPADPQLLPLAVQAVPANDPWPILHVWGRQPLSDRLRTALRKELTRTADTPSGPRLLADEDIEAAITGWRRIALARLLPDDPYASSLFRQLHQHLANGRRMGWSWPEAIEVSVGLAPPAHVPHLICRLADRLQRRGFTAGGRTLLEAAVHRLRRDPEAEEAVIEAIIRPGTPDADFPAWRLQGRTVSPAPSAGAHQQLLLAGVLATATHLPAAVATALAPLADSDAVLHDNPLMTSRPISLAVLDLLDTTR
ncbi:hypothetical protein AMK33_38745 [Streptomyces sp. CB02400]|nr:hypothetical protein AMK33_38745 [Streptomyces sp. CB02400]